MSVLPFPSFLDDVKEKGLKRAVFEGINEVTERVTAGMNLQDIREALRGEPASRKPNPRLTPHADGFWLHMRPSYFNREVTGLYPTFRLGWLSTYFVFFETITGIFLMIYYTPSPLVAYENMLNILSNVPLGQLMRDLHRLGAEAMVLIVALHMLRTFLTGSYKKPRQFTWATGIILLAATLFLSFSGYLLPWDQLALWAVTIGASMAEAVPPEIVGTNVNLLLRGGPEIGANGLLRFYLLHVLLVPAILFIFTGVHYYKVIIHAHSLPPKSEAVGEDTAKRVPLDKRVYFIPDVLTSEIMWIAVTTLVLVVLSTWFYHAPLETHADPQLTPIGTTAPWYFLWLQGVLKLGDKVFWGVIFPGILTGLLLVIPYIDMGVSRRFAHRRFMLSFGMFLIAFITITSYMGLPEFGVRITADQDILHELVKPPAYNRMGLFLPVPYDQLVVGAYTTREIEAEPGQEEAAIAALNEELAGTEAGQALRTRLINTDNLNVQDIRFTTIPSDATELRAVIEEWQELMAARTAELPDATGMVVITQTQDNLKRLDAVIMWREPAAAVPESEQVAAEGEGEAAEQPSEILRIEAQHVFIHQDAEYFAAPGA